MDVPGSSEDDALAQSTRARIFTLLVRHRGAMGTRKIAATLGMHPNGVRRHLERLQEAGLVERRQIRGTRGRPGDSWAVAAGARPDGKRPSGYADLAGWLARATPGEPRRLTAIEESGREIGFELAPGSTDDPVEGFRSALSALGFQPELERHAQGGFACRLGNCPYREAALESPDVVCTMHRGITAGLLGALDPGATLTRFEARDPRRAGCVVEVEGGDGA